jgi:hypothetical protein
MLTPRHLGHRDRDRVRGHRDRDRDRDRVLKTFCVYVTAGKAPSDPEKALKLFKSFFYITHMQQVRCCSGNYLVVLRSWPRP